MLLLKLIHLGVSTYEIIVKALTTARLRIYDAVTDKQAVLLHDIIHALYILLSSVMSVPGDKHNKFISTESIYHTSFRLLLIKHPRHSL